MGSEFIIKDYRNDRIATIAKHLLDIGIEVDYVSAVSAQEDRLEEILRQAIARSTLIFAIGGILSGEYDVIKKLLTRILKKRLVLNYRILDTIKEQYARQGDVMPRTAEKLALVPSEAEVIENEAGTMPGFLFTKENTHVALLPGNAPEISVMLQKHIIPRLDIKTFRIGMVKTFIIKTCGIPASTVKEQLKQIEREHLRQVLNYITDGEETSIIVTLRGDRPQEIEGELENIEQQIRTTLGNIVYGTGSQTLEEVVGSLLVKQKKTAALAESCTGGLISHKLTNIPGSSEYFDRGVVSYSNEAKMTLLDVSPNLIEKYGAVSAETAVAMAEGVRWLARTSFGLAVTGIAGPSGGTPTKPVGLVYIALASDQAHTQWKKFNFSGDRLSIKNRTAQAALNMLRLVIDD